jgi:hypothetical protein
MHQRLSAVFQPTGIDMEWIVVDASSRDETFAVAQTIAGMDRRVRAFRFSRNFGSPTATICGLDHACGDCAVAMAADLQDPPETIPELFAEWLAGNHVVWAVRARRDGESRSTLAFSRFYYWIMRHVAGLKEMPAMGADFVLLDRRVIDAICRFPEQNTSLFGLITWMGFRQTAISYEKQARVHGRSGWTLRKKIKLVVDSLTSFTYQPVRWMSLMGLVVSILGAIYAMVVVVNALLGAPVQGWTSLMGRRPVSRGRADVHARRPRRIYLARPRRIPASAPLSYRRSCGRRNRRRTGAPQPAGYFFPSGSKRRVRRRRSRETRAALSQDLTILGASSGSRGIAGPVEGTKRLRQTRFG